MADPDGLSDELRQAVSEARGRLDGKTETETTLPANRPVEVTIYALGLSGAARNALTSPDVGRLPIWGVRRRTIVIGTASKGYRPVTQETEWLVRNVDLKEAAKLLVELGTLGE